MLVLTRRKNESITIGDSIRVTVLRVDSGQVRLGIEAPAGCRIMRGELLAQARPGEPAVETPADENLKTD